MKIKRKIVEIDEEKCDGCGQCVPSCAEGAIQIVDGKARLFSEKYCDGLGACLGECPNDALRVVEREAEDFDEVAVEEHLRSREATVEGATMACGCPSAHIQSFASPTSREEDSEPVEGGVSTLSHWPVKIRLVPPTAPFLKGADLLVAADCTPLAYPDFHRDFIKGKVILVGCPKLDDAEDYVQRFADIFRSADIKSVTVVAMEVPCCQALPVIVKKGMELAGRKIPIDQVTIGVRGDVLKRERLAVVDFLLKKKGKKV